MTMRKARVSRPVNGLVRPPSSYEEYLLLSEKDKLRLMKQEQAKRPNVMGEAALPASKGRMKSKKTIGGAGSMSPESAGSGREQDEIAKIAEAKKGHYIRMRCWTEANHSSAETSAKSITSAVRFIRLHGQFHANWSIEFRSEPNATGESRRIRRTLDPIVGNLDSEDYIHE